jgi:hypothetical protein
MDRQKRNPIIGQNPKLLRLEKRQAADVINVVSGFKLNYPEGKGTVNMCLAIQEMRIESEMEGAVETYKEIGFSLAETIKRIAERFQLSESEASETVKLYW